MAGLSHYQVKEEWVLLGFDFVLDVSTLVNANFTLIKEPDDLHETVPDPFDEIVITRDYYSTTRELYLYWGDDVLEENTNYRINISNLKSPFGITAPTFYVDFTTYELATPSSSGSPWTKEPSNIEDYSVKTITDLFLDIPVSGDDAGIFSVKSITPDNSESFYLSPTAHNGYIHIVFNKDIEFDSSHFKLTRKNLAGSGIAIWETVNIDIIQGPNPSDVAIFLPSQDDPPVYSHEIGDIDGHTFWVEGYKYKLVISGSLKSVDDETLGTSHTSYYLGILDPLFLDPEVVLTYYDEGDLVEITELIHWYSKEVLNILDVSSLSEVTPLIQEYILASVLCDLSKIYLFGGGLGGFTSSNSFTLGDLQVKSSSGFGNAAGTNGTRGGVANWCDLAALIRDELKNTGAHSRAYVRGQKYCNYVPSRLLKRLD